MKLTQWGVGMVVICGQAFDPEIRAQNAFRPGVTKPAEIGKSPKWFDRLSDHARMQKLYTLGRRARRGIWPKWNFITDEHQNWIFITNEHQNLQIAIVK